MRQLLFFILFTTLFIACDKNSEDPILENQPNLTEIRIKERPCEMLEYVGRIGNDFDFALDSLRNLKNISSEIMVIIFSTMDLENSLFDIFVCKKMDLPARLPIINCAKKNAIQIRTPEIKANFERLQTLNFKNIPKINIGEQKRIPCRKSE